MRGNRAALASPTRLKDAATRFSAAIISGLRSRICAGIPVGMGGKLSVSSAMIPKSPFGYCPTSISIALRIF